MRSRLDVLLLYWNQNISNVLPPVVVVGRGKPTSALHWVPQVRARGVVEWTCRRTSCPGAAVPVGLATVVAWESSLTTARSVTLRSNVMGVASATDTRRGLTCLFSRICVSVVPTSAPAGLGRLLIVATLPLTVLASTPDGNP